MGGTAWVTLATNDSYALGALVVANSLKRVNTVHDLAILITPGVTLAMKNELIKVFSFVKEVDVFDSRDETNLKLLSRPDLGITFTKIHAWRLTQYSKCVFLDADVLIVQNCDELFDREELSAAPDAGWPDCFNSGVFVFKPSDSTYNALVDFALVNGSFDGGDQGLLNLYFSDWATADSSKRLPFVYNMCSTSTYSYLPALKQFGSKVKIIHFIGSSKPWLQHFDPTTRTILSGDSHLTNFLQLWWDVFVVHVHPTLSTEMAGLARALAQVPIGTPISAEQLAYEDHIHRQHWEEGHIDYLGKDSWDNIWKQISQTIDPTKPPAVETSATPSQPKVESNVSPVHEVKPTAGVEPVPVSPAVAVPTVDTKAQPSTTTVATPPVAASVAPEPTSVEAPVAPVSTPVAPVSTPVAPVSIPVAPVSTQVETPVAFVSTPVETSAAPVSTTIKTPAAPVSTPVVGTPVSTPTEAPVAPAELPSGSVASEVTTPTDPTSNASTIALDAAAEVKPTESSAVSKETLTSTTESSAPILSTPVVPSTPPIEAPAAFPLTPDASPSAPAAIVPTATPTDISVAKPEATPIAPEEKPATPVPTPTTPETTPATALASPAATPVAPQSTPVAAPEAAAPVESAPTSAVSAAIASAVAMAAAPAVSSTTPVTPSTPTVTSPTPPQSPLSDVASKLEKLEINPSIAEATSATASEPPVPPKRKGSKETQGKGGKGKK